MAQPKILLASESKLKLGAIIAFFEKNYPGHTFYFISDNTSKDFMIPAKLGWKMICIKDNGLNIHKQDLKFSVKDVKLISSFDEIRIQ